MFLFVIMATEREKLGEEEKCDKSFLYLICVVESGASEKGGDV
jgi:hypothetical protein